MGLYFNALQHILAVGTVCCEPVSAQNSLLSWENTGNILII